MKKILVALLVLAAVLSVTTPASAEGPPFGKDEINQECIRDGHFDIHPCTVRNIKQMPDGRWVGIYDKDGTTYWCEYDGATDTWWCEPLAPEGGDVDAFTEGTGYDLVIEWEPPGCVALGCPLDHYEVRYTDSGGRSDWVDVELHEPRSLTLQVNGGDWYHPHVTAHYGLDTYVIMHFGGNAWEACGYPALVG